MYALAIALAVSTTGCGIKGPLQSAKEAPTPATKPAKPAPPEKL
ncbi:MAG TPA: lipoprotein [Casimicrobiaceae bacterium]|nr:lipoprotein [Casimicrobiaceae bacterium]